MLGTSKFTSLQTYFVVSFITKCPQIKWIQNCWNSTSCCLHLLVYAFKWKRVKIFDQFAINVSKCMIFNTLGLQNYFVISVISLYATSLQLCCKRKIYKEIYRMFAGDFLMLHNKRHFVISVMAINMFYCTQHIDCFYIKR